MTLEEFKTLAINYKESFNISTEEVYNIGIMCSWSTNIEFKATVRDSSEVLVKDMSVEDYNEQIRMKSVTLLKQMTFQCDKQSNCLL